MSDFIVGDVPDIKVDPTGDSAQINDYPTTIYELKTDGRKSQQLYVTPWDNLVGSDQVMSTMQEMSGFMNEMMQAMSNGPMANMMPSTAASNWLDPLSKINGFPVMVKEYDSAGNQTSETKLLSIKERTIDPSTFQAPSGYRRQNLDF